MPIPLMSNLYCLTKVNKIFVDRQKDKICCFLLWLSFWRNTRYKGHHLRTVVQAHYWHERFSEKVSSQYRYETMKYHVLSVRVVLADGTVGQTRQSIIESSACELRLDTSVCRLWRNVWNHFSHHITSTQNSYVLIQHEILSGRYRQGPCWSSRASPMVLSPEKTTLCRSPSSVTKWSRLSRV